MIAYELPSITTESGGPPWSRTRHQRIMSWLV